MDNAFNLIKTFLEQTSMSKTLKSLELELKERQLGRISIKDILNFNGKMTSLI